MRDLNDLSYGDWVDFIFNHPVTSIQSAWHFEIEGEYVCKAEKLIDNMTVLFQNTSHLSSQYSLEQIEQGFWFIPGSNGFIWAILSPEVSIQKRYRCIDSITFLFSELFCKYSELNTVSYMWWDSIFSYCALESRNLSNEFKVLDRIALAISKLLNTDCEVSKQSAEHGLEHIIKIFKITYSTNIRNIIASNFGVEVLSRL